MGLRVTQHVPQVIKVVDELEFAIPVMVLLTAIYATIESARVVLTTILGHVHQENAPQPGKPKVMVPAPVRLVQSDQQTMIFVKTVIQVVPPVLQM